MYEKQEMPTPICDLACECGLSGGLGLVGETEEHVHCTVSRADINNEASKLISKPAGRYVSLFFGNVWELDRDALDEISELFARELAVMSNRLTDTKKPKVLMVGLGNGNIVFDSLGARVCRLMSPDGDSFFVFKIGVLGESGIESQRLVKALAACVEADLVIAVDSLVARSETRVGRVIQLADSGISPASGVGRHSGEISRATVGVPVVAVGLPSALWAGDSLARDGYLAVPETAQLIAENSAELIADGVKRFFTSV